MTPTAYIDELPANTLATVEKETPLIVQTEYQAELDKRTYARTCVQKAVQTGVLIKPSECSKCGSTGNIEAHHSDYDRPLEVIWLCVPCHRKIPNNSVRQETFRTLPFAPPETMVDDELADVVIRICGKMRDYLPYIIALKERFDAGDRDSLNRLQVPIKGCHSWKEFCTSILGRTPQAIGEAMRTKKLKGASRTTHELTAADINEYEQEHPGTWKLTQKLLAGGLPPGDAVSALVNMDTPQEIAEAIVELVSAEQIAPQENESENETLPIIEVKEEVVPIVEFSSAADAAEAAIKFINDLVKPMTETSKAIVYGLIIEDCDANTSPLLARQGKLSLIKDIVSHKKFWKECRLDKPGFAKTLESERFDGLVAILNVLTKGLTAIEAKEIKACDNWNDVSIEFYEIDNDRKKPNTVRDDLIKEITVLSKPLKMNKVDSKQFEEFLDEIQGDKTFLFGIDELKDIRKSLLDKANLPIFAAWLVEHPQGSWCCFFNIIRPGTFTDDEVSAVISDDPTEESIMRMNINSWRNPSVMDDAELLRKIKFARKNQEKYPSCVAEIIKKLTPYINEALKRGLNAAVSA